MENVNDRFYIMNHSRDKLKSLKDYVKQWIEANPGGKVSVGTDSQQRGRRIAYATVIVLIHEFKRGAHVLFTKDTEEKQKLVGKMSDGDIFVRLSGEAIRSIDVANFLSENGIKVHSIELDYQRYVGTKSSSSYSANSGWIKSLGYEVLGKDSETVLMAVRAADGLVKPKSRRRGKYTKKIA